MPLKDHNPCTKEAEIAGLKVQTEEASKKCIHIYAQIEELRNTLQHLSFSMMNCKDAHSKETSDLKDHIHALSQEQAVHEAKSVQPQQPMSITVNPTISPTLNPNVSPTFNMNQPVSSGTASDESDIVSAIKRPNWAVAVLAGGGIVIGFIFVGIYLYGKAKGWFQ